MIWDILRRRLGIEGRVGLLLVVGLLTMPATDLGAQSTWEITPYRTRVWWVAGSQPTLPTTWSSEFGDRLETRLRTTFRVVWDGDVVPAPDTLAADLLADLRQVSRERVLEVTPELLKLDKLFLVSVEGLRDSYRVRVRELDCRLAHFGPTQEVEVEQLSRLTGRIAQLIEVAFSPVVLIERTKDKTANVRLRAAALLRGEQVPGALHPGDLLLPFDRRVGIDGSTRLKDIRAIDWTYLLVDDRQPNEMLQTEIVSGYRQPFRSRPSRRQEQLAIRARPRSDQSTIRLQSRAEPPQPLVGYEIHEKGVRNTEFIGHTNFRGELVIPATHRPVRILLVKSGERVTAKLPIVPGLRDVVVASMLDDRQRVETDGFLSGIQIALVDLVARRESLSTRIRHRISTGELDQARELLETFRGLPTQIDFRRQIQQQQQALRVTDPLLRRRIDTMFVDAYRTLGQYLDPERMHQLESELQLARQREAGTAGE